MGKKQSFLVPNPAPQVLRQGQWCAIDLADPNRTLLDFIRSPKPAGLGCTGTKEGCAQGDCGACAVLIAEPNSDGGRLQVRAVNACIRLASSAAGCALWTVEDLASPDGALHPVQQAMVDAHGSQCGFCTPGFVVSLMALHEQALIDGRADNERPTRAEVLESISGNLCRCTGYRPIVEAGLNVDMTKSTLLPDGADALLGRLNGSNDVRGAVATKSLRPTTMRALLRLRSQYPQAQVVAGTTDVGLWITKHHRRFESTLDVTGVAALRVIRRRKTVLEIGAAARLTEAFDALCAEWPELQTFCSRFAGLTIRNSATLGGNIANGSPIGDSMPLLISLQASLILSSVRGEREMPIEDFFLAYRKTALAGDEIIRSIRVPRRRANQRLRAYKVSKRFEDDISAVCLAISIDLGPGNLVERVRIGAGGVAATPARARQTETALLGSTLNTAQADTAAQVLQGEFEPIADMRASAGYRRTVLGALLRRFALELEGVPVSMEEQVHAR